MINQDSICNKKAIKFYFNLNNDTKLKLQKSTGHIMSTTMEILLRQKGNIRVLHLGITVNKR